MTPFLVLTPLGLLRRDAFAAALRECCVQVHSSAVLRHGPRPRRGSTNASSPPPRSSAPPASSSAGACCAPPIAPSVGCWRARPISSAAGGQGRAATALRRRAPRPGPHGATGVPAACLPRAGRRCRGGRSAPPARVPGRQLNEELRRRHRRFRTRDDWATSSANSRNTILDAGSGQSTTVRGRSAQHSQRPTANRTDTESRRTSMSIAKASYVRCIAACALPSPLPRASARPLQYRSPRLPASPRPAFGRG